MGWRSEVRAKRSLPRELLTDEESDRLLEQCDGSLVGLRNRALLLLLEGTGCRISEVLALEPRDLDWEAGTVHVREGHGGHERVVSASPEALVATRTWLEERRVRGVPEGSPLCCGVRGGPLTASYARRLLSQLGRDAGLRKRVHAHGLRHRFTARLVRHGVIITSVSYALGHQSVASTYEYLRQLGLDHALDDVQRALDTQDRFASAPPDPGLELPERPLERCAAPRAQPPQQKRNHGRRERTG